MITLKTFNKLKKHFEEDLVVVKATFEGTGKDKNTPYIKLKERFKRIRNRVQEEMKEHEIKRKNKDSKEDAND